MNQLIVQRMNSKITSVWIDACMHANVDVRQQLKVIRSGSHGYHLENLPGIWDVRSFEIVPMEDTQGQKDLEKLSEQVFAEKSNAVINPNHYDMMGANTIEILAAAMTKKEWRGFCLGNTLKYRIRAGKKDDLKQDIDKANNYERLYEEHKHLCRKGKKKSKE